MAVFFSNLFLVSRHLLNKTDCLTDLKEESVEVIEVLLDLLEGKICEHFSDFWGIGITDELLNKGVDELTNYLIEILVLGDNRFQHLETLLVVVIQNRVRIRKIS